MKEERDEKNNKTELKRELKKANGGDGGREGGDTSTGKGGNEGDL